MNTERIKELKKFKEDFNAKLQEAFKLYESKLTLKNALSKEKIKNKKIIVKSHSTKILKENPIFPNKIALTSNSIKDLKPKKVKRFIHISKKTWKIQHMAGDIFEKEFKRLKNNYEMSNWDIYRIDLSERSYAKEKNTLTGHNLVCRNLCGKEISRYPNIEKTISESINGLTKSGKQLISKNIIENKNKEKILRRNETNIFRFMHSKPPIILNKWKYSNHVKDYFSVPPLDKIYSFKEDTRPEPTYKVRPFRRPKDHGDYFDKHIGILYN